MFTIAAAALALMLTAAAVLLTSVSDRRRDDLRTQGPHMKRVGGVLLIIVGLWFVYLAVANPTYLLS